MTITRRRPTERVTSALWGALVAGVGALMIATFSGYEVDLELAGIIALVALGGWLVLSAVLSSKPRERSSMFTESVYVPPVREPSIDTPVTAAPKASGSSAATKTTKPTKKSTKPDA